MILTSCGSTKNLGGGIYEETFTVWSENSRRDDWVSAWKKASNVCSSQGKILDIIKDDNSGKNSSWTIRFKCIDLATKQQRDLEYAKAEEDRQKQLKNQRELDRKISIEQEQENQRKIKAEEKIIKQRELAENRRKQALFEKCLSIGAIGMCRTYAGGRELYDDKDDTGWGNNKIYTQHLIRNNLTRPVKDIELQCDQFGASGTRIKTYNNTIYENWGPDESKVIESQFWPHNQLNTIKCFVKNWKPSFRQKLD